MRISRRIASVFVSAVLFLCFLICSRQAYPQAQDLSAQATLHGIQLYEQGNAREAIKLLTAVVAKRPEDADAWYFLGLSLHREGMFGHSRPAFEKLLTLRPDSADARAKLAFAMILDNESQKAIAMAQRALELGDQSPEAHYAIAEGSLRTGAPAKAIEEAENTLRINPNFSAALITRSLAQCNLKQYSESAASLEQFLALSPDDLDAATWRGQLDELSNLTHQVSSQSSQVFGGKDITQKARVLSKPEPQYSEAARKAGVTGTVVIRAVFAADGEVKRIFVIKALGYGLTTQSAKAARRIKFEPAMKDGQPVSMYMMLEYNFNLY
jgi:TonB family protein